MKYLILLILLFPTLVFGGVTCSGVDLEHVNIYDAPRILVIGDSIALSNTCYTVDETYDGTGWFSPLQAKLKTYHLFVGIYNRTAPTVAWGTMTDANVLGMHDAYDRKYTIQTSTYAYGGSPLSRDSSPNRSALQYCETTSCIERFIPDPKATDLIIVMSGRNDIFAYPSFDNDTAITGLDTFVDYVVAYDSDINIIYANVLPKAGGSSIDTRIINFNTDLEGYVDGKGKANFFYFDDYTPFRNNASIFGTDGEGAGYVQPNGSHLTNTGCDYMAELLYNFMKTNGLTE